MGHLAGGIVYNYSFILVGNVLIREICMSALLNKLGRLIFLFIGGFHGKRYYYYF